MDIDKELSRAAQRLSSSLDREPIPPSPRPPGRPWYATAIAACVLTLGVVGVVYIATSNRPSIPAAATTTTTLDAPTPQTPGLRTITLNELTMEVDVPEGWQVAPEVLASALAPGRQSTFEVLSIGTFEMRPGGENCDYLPENAIRDMAPTDVLVSIRFNFTPSTHNAPNLHGHIKPWPTPFGPDSWPPAAVASKVAACTGRDDVDDRWATYSQADQEIAVTAIFGDEVTEGTVSETYAVINSFVVGTLNSEPYDPGYAQSWTIEYGPQWHRDDSYLMPAFDEQSTTLATFPLVPGGHLCAYLPTNAVNGLAPEDVFVFIRLVGSEFIHFEGPIGPYRPVAGFNDETFPAEGRNEFEHCSQHPGLEAHTGYWTIDGNPVYLVVAFGDNVPDDLRAETWAMVSSLRTEPVPASRNRGMCIATRPPVPGPIPPDPWNPTPSSSEVVWYGTPDLWAPLRIDGMHEERPSIWWSQNFTDPARESSPEISVTYERIDRTGVPVATDGPGTNAMTVEDGLFMIADIPFEPPTPGCWSVTGRYKGASLSYVTNVP